MRWFHAVPAVLLLLVLAVATPAYAQLAVGPLVRELRTDADTGSIEIVVRNDHEHQVEIVVAVNDWAVDDDGNHTFRPAGSLPGGCGEQVTTSHPRLHLAAGDSTAVRVQFRPGALRSCRNIVFFRVSSSPDVLAGDQLIISTGVKVYVDPRAGSGSPQR